MKLAYFKVVSSFAIPISKAYAIPKVNHLRRRPFVTILCVKLESWARYSLVSEVLLRRRLSIYDGMVALQGLMEKAKENEMEGKC